MIERKIFRVLRSKQDEYMQLIKRFGWEVVSIGDFEEEVRVRGEWTRLHGRSHGYAYHNEMQVSKQEIEVRLARDIDDDKRSIILPIENSVNSNFENLFTPKFNSSLTRSLNPNELKDAKKTFIIFVVLAIGSFLLILTGPLMGIEIDTPTILGALVVSGILFAIGGYKYLKASGKSKNEKNKIDHNRKVHQQLYQDIVNAGNKVSEILGEY